MVQWMVIVKAELFRSRRVRYLAAELSHQCDGRAEPEAGGGARSGSGNSPMEELSYVWRLNQAIARVASGVQRTEALAHNDISATLAPAIASQVRERESLLAFCAIAVRRNHRAWSPLRGHS